MRPTLLCCCCCSLLLLLVAGPLLAAQRHVAILVDTSGSMDGNDSQRYTMQLSQIISDLLEQGDTLTVVRMGNDSCSARPSSALALRLDVSNRDQFKARLDAHTAHDTGTNYAEAIRTAIAALAVAPEQQRMLLIIADSGGMGSCEHQLTRELLALRQSGAVIAAVNLGSTAGAFDGNPAFTFTTAALDADRLVNAVALIYQRFLGSKQVQTGHVNGAIQVEIAPLVGEAFLVVVADGPMPQLQEAAGNPTATRIDLDLYGGGETRGIDGKLRAYRIVHLSGPQAGRWTFHAPGLTDSAGWMLLQDSAVTVRLVSAPEVAEGIASPVEVELYDQRTGERISDLSLVPGLDLSIEVDGQQIRLRDDGSNGDRQPGDGIFTGITTLQQTGRSQIPVHLVSDQLDRTSTIELEVRDAAWQLQVGTPAQVAVDQPVVLTVQLQALGARSALKVPERIEVTTGSATVLLADSGENGDSTANDLVYSGAWTPHTIGETRLEYLPRGGTPVAAVIQPVQVLGTIDLGDPVAINLGRLESGSVGTGLLELATARIRGVFTAELSCNLELERAALEINTGSGWQPLTSEPSSLELTENGALSWPVRLRVGSCPGSTSPGQTFEILVTAQGPNGQPRSLTAPLQVEVVADSWLACWWPLLALISAVIAVGVVIHGLVSPARFPPRLGVVLSPEEEMAEGFFHPIRGQRGSGSGFYRDARIWIGSDFRLSANPQNALVRLRAAGPTARIAPAPGASVWRRSADDSWERLPCEETPARFGTLYRDELGTLYFEIRNG